MKKVIGIVGEGPIDQMVLKAAINRITGESHIYRNIQPEIVIPCDSTDAWTVAAYEEDIDDIEAVVDPWERIISLKKEYHGIRIPGHKKNTAIYRLFLPQIINNWDSITGHCGSARKLETDIRQWAMKS